ncbi:hypothetical protein PV797_09945 [Clostridiaceae bacterium M8S5]|nr:hypothetical protein PV797_09945 [Clostridiaceae bacterium M8S5]
MNGNIEILNYIHQNSEMGRDTLKQLINIVKDSGFKKELKSQFDEYNKIYSESEKMLSKLNKEAKSIKQLSKISTYIMISLKTLTDKTPSHISQMLIQGSTMGVIDITKKLKEYKDADSKILKLGDKLLKFEQKNIEELKKFL